MEPPTPTPPPRAGRDRQITLIVYLLYLLAPLAGLTAVIAIIVNYLKREEVAGNWLASHFTWQIRTFWWALAIAALVALVGLVLLPALGLGLVVWWIGFLALGIWAIYRIARGWLRLKDRQPMPAP
jgi:uncharacterized membrane protein